MDDRIDTAVIAAGGIVSAVIFGRQLSVMQGQLDEMREESRPWVGIDLIQNDTVVESGKDFKIITHIKNFGRNPSPKVKGCIASDTPNIHQRDKAGLAKMMEALSGCKDVAETVLMPGGGFSFNASRKGTLTTDTVARDINNGFATFAAFGRLDYEDSTGTKYWTTFCAFTSARPGNLMPAPTVTRHISNKTQIARAHMARSISSGDLIVIPAAFAP